MSEQYYPSSAAGDVLEAYLAQYAGKSAIIYGVVLIVLCGGLGLLPVLKVDVSVQSSGLIRPIVEKSDVRAQVSGPVEEVLVREHELVRKGQLLATVQTNALKEQAALLRSKLAEKRAYLADLDLLVTEANRSAGATPRLQTSKYRQAYAAFGGEHAEWLLREQKAERELKRLEQLFDREAVARSEVENAAFQMEQARSGRLLLLEQQRSRWENDRLAYREEIAQLLLEHEQLKARQALHRIEAPVTGTVEQLVSLDAGSYVQAGERIAVLSPQSELVAEMSVMPKDIGMLAVGTPVQMQIDAFNYNEWGFVTGTVVEIADDFTVVDGQPVFRVRCSLDRTTLRLKNGFEGRLKKGMTLQGRFFVARRTLMQLLYDDVNDWLNPKQA